MTVASMEQLIGGWGNHPVERCHVSRPETIAELRELVTMGRFDYIARGLGRAYGDSAINAGRGVTVQTRFNRFLAFDENTGLLECEAGLSIEEIIEHLLPRGWFVPVTPGTKHVTIGGAIAADIHGKNHHVDGTFGSHVEEIELLIADGRVLRVRPTGEHRDLFWATLGGMGLTGIILSAKVRLRRVETSYFSVRYIKSRNLEESLENLAKTNHEYRYSVAWVDCLATGKSLGRSVLMLSNEGRVEDLPTKLRRDPLRVASKLKAVVPLELPGFVLNEFSVRAFNNVFYGSQSNAEKIVDYDTFYYPLDRVLHWNRIYGRRGFVQYQALFPPKTTLPGLIAILERIGKSRRASFLSVLKSSGPANPSPLSYLYEGHTLALDLPFTSDLPELARDLDRILLEHGGRLYLAKDALTTKENFAEMYPRLPEFLRIKAAVDPQQRFASSQARRLGIV
jgi:decaprenylphospho-beta-D-ribofuranose 2-oxidase